MRHFASRHAFRSLLIACAMTGFGSIANAHTITVTSASMSMGLSTSNFTNTGTPAYGPVGSYTFQVKNSYVLFAFDKGGEMLNLGQNGQLNPTYNWTFKWTPSGPSDTPGETVGLVLKQRYQYDLIATLAGSTLNTGDVSSTFLDTLGLPGLTCSVTGSAIQNLEDATGSTWVLGSDVLATGSAWVLQADGTYLASVSVPESLMAGCIAQEMSTTSAVKNVSGTVSFTTQITIESVQDINFTLWG